MGTTTRRFRLPAGPLLEAVERAGGINRCHGSVAARRAYFRAKAVGHLSVWAADRVAVELLGVHPAAVWGADWV